MAGTPITAVKEHGFKSEVRHLREEHNKVVTDLETLRAAIQAGGVTLVNEMRDDISAGTNNYRDCITEAKADIATIATFEAEAKTDIGTIATFETEAKADIATIATFEAEAKTDIGTISTFETEAKADIGTISTFDTEAKADIATIATFEAEVKTDIGTISTFETEAKADIGTISTFDTEAKADIATIATFEAEVKTDSGTISTFETEAKADIATIATFETEAKADIATIATFEAEAKTDIGTISTFETEAKADIATIATFEAEAKTDIGTVATWEAEVDADLDTINNYIDRLANRDGIIFANHAIECTDDGGSDIDLTAGGIIYYRISGQEYHYVCTGAEAHQLAGTGGTGAGEVDQTKWGAWRITINALGVIGSDYATGQDATPQVSTSEQDALLSLAASARGAGEVDIGYVTVNANTGGFTTGTDDPVTADAQVVAANYYECRSPMLDNGLTAAPSVGLGISATADELSVGTLNVRQNGKAYAEIAADLTFPLTDNDLVTDNKFGGWLIMVDRAGTAIISVSADGLAEATTMAYDSDALLITAITNAITRLPQLFTVVGTVRIAVDTLGGSFTANTTEFSDAAVTDTYVDELSTGWDRTAAGDAMPRGIPTIPDSVTAPAVSAMSATAVVAMDATAVAGMSATAVEAMTASAVEAMAATALATMGATAVVAMDAPVVGTMSATPVAGMSATAVEAMTAGVVETMAATPVAGMSASAVEAMTASAVGAMSATAVVAMTEVVPDALGSAAASTTAVDAAADMTAATVNAS